jgi:hypothetical protein
MYLTCSYALLFESISATENKEHLRISNKRAVGRVKTRFAWNNSSIVRKIAALSPTIFLSCCYSRQRCEARTLSASSLPELFARILLAKTEWKDRAECLYDLQRRDR